jgi:hypothetical protein
MQRLRRLLLLSLAVLPLSSVADEALDRLFPVRGLSIAAPSSSQVERFTGFMREVLAVRGVNTLILRVDYNFEYDSHPELRDRNALSRADVKALVKAGRAHGIRLIPQINLLGHQSWASRVGNLLRVYPEFDETPWVEMPEKHAWPNADGLYCKSYCPLHPEVHDVVFALVDELCDAFEADAFHAGMDEVFYIGSDKCPRCSGKNKAELFAGEVRLIRDHLAAKNRQLWIWGDRLLDGKATGLGEWEASTNDTHPAIDMIPKDVVICDWHYERAEPTAAYFALKGFNVVTCPWKNPDAAAQQVNDMVRLRTQANPSVQARALGMVQTVWSGANSFLDSYERYVAVEPAKGEVKSEAACFIRAFAEMRAAAGQ